MDAYIGTKIVQAEPMDDVTFTLKVRALPGIVTVDPDGHGRPGYKVVYDDGYVSWSPKDVFERCYRKITEAERDVVATAIGVQ